MRGGGNQSPILGFWGLSQKLFSHSFEWLPQNPIYPLLTAKATVEWLKNKNINVLEWPSRSPDRNPIENLRHDLKIAIHQRSPRNLTELEQFCAEKWANIAQSRCVKLVETYPNRLTAVIAVKGASTKY